MVQKGEPSTQVHDLKFESCQNKGLPNIHVTQLFYKFAPPSQTSNLKKTKMAATYLLSVRNNHMPTFKFGVLTLKCIIGYTTLMQPTNGTYGISGTETLTFIYKRFSFVTEKQSLHSADTSILSPIYSDPKSDELNSKQVLSTIQAIEKN